MSTTTAAPRFFTSAEVARLTRYHPKSLHLLPHPFPKPIRIGTKRLWPAQAVLDVLDRLEAEAQESAVRDAS